MHFDTVRDRVSKLRCLMKERDIDALVLMVFERFNTESCHYISGFRGSSAALIIDMKKEMLITDGRYRTQAAGQSPFELTVQTAFPLPDFVAKAVIENNYKVVGIESEKLFHSVFETSLKSVSVKWVDASSLIPSLRRAKGQEEIALIKKAGVLAREAYDRTLAQVRLGMTEAEFENRLSYEVKQVGAEKGWAHDDFIVVSGTRGALCHGRATDKVFQTGDIVTVDFGVMVEGYMSDITRNFAINKADEKALEIDKILVHAKTEAASAIRPGISGKEVDAIARDIIIKAGYEKNFVHGLGHGLGLEVHEAPRLSFVSKDILRAGDVVTVEPGIYIEGWGGMRVEDDYLVTDNGVECLTQSDDQHLRVISCS